MKKFLAVVLSIIFVFSSFGAISVSADTTINYGDVNSDSAINNKDLGLLMQYLNSWEIALFDYAAADVNADDSINNKDYGLLMQYINNWDVKLGEQPIIPPDTNNKTHTPLSADEYYQYNSLNNNHKQVYNEVLKAIKETRNIIDVSSYNILEEDGRLITEKVLADHPEFFYVTRYITVNLDASTQNVTNIFIYYTDGTTVDQLSADGELTFVSDRKNIREQIEKFNTRTEEILKKIPADCETVVKEKMIFDYVAANAVYDEIAGQITSVPFGTALGHAWDTYGMLVEGKVVCEGYAKAFAYLCHCVGINATTVTGYTTQGNHMWSTAQIDGEWYMLDATYGDIDFESPDYTFFNRTSDELSSTHVVTTSLAVPRCNATTNSFYNSFVIDITSGSLPENYRTIIDRLYISGDACMYFKKYANQGLSFIYLENVLFVPIFDYINEKGYNIELLITKSYRFEDIMYTPLKRT